ncbi:MAG: 3-oxoacyl-ACP reductase FabG [Actinomycetota bacterium]|nr:3-oxoacyl-ACP reductase FabG [Actinomycetota bacterium]
MIDAGTGHRPSAPVAIVTGGGRNIGRAIVLELAAGGADVGVVVRSNRAEAEAVAEEVRALGRRASVGIADVRDEQAVAIAANEIRRALGPPTILVNNAAARPEGPFLELSLEDWREVTGVILDGAFLCSREVLPDMLEAGWGRIVMIAGLSGQTGATHRAHVVAGKAGLIGLTKALALEYAAHNITVNAVSPGMIDTTRVGAEPKHHGGLTIPVGRRGRPEEIAAMVRYIVSDEAAFITGQTLNVSGGLLL